MKLQLKNNSYGETFDCPRGIGLALLATGVVVEPPKEEYRAPQFFPKPKWTIAEGRAGGPVLYGSCGSCAVGVEAIGMAARTVFMCHCGIAKDYPPADIVKRYSKSFEKAPKPQSKRTPDFVPAGRY
jgi:hypothetical protein